ncbi:MAG TPA: NUDIX domain-containing protein [Frankiaceae bacterium]|nr:NUDIX domain-containing protein [Frankiaceae bacterium]
MPIRCVGAVVTDSRGRILLVQRANEPGRGLWSLPGGRVEPGETDEQAVVREVAEETGLTVEVGRLVGRVQIDDYDVGDYSCRVVDGDGTGGNATAETAVAAASDALDAGYLDPRTVPTTPRLVEILTSWGVLPPAADSVGEP